MFSSSSEDEDSIQLANLNTGAASSSARFHTHHPQKHHPHRRHRAAPAAIAVAVEVEAIGVAGEGQSCDDASIHKTHRRCVSYGSTRDLGIQHRRRDVVCTTCTESAHLNATFEHKTFGELSTSEEQSDVIDRTVEVTHTSDLDMLSDAKTDKNVYLLNVSFRQHFTFNWNATIVCT